MKSAIKTGTLPVIAVGLALLPAAVVIVCDRGTPTVFEPAKLRLLQAGVAILATTYLSTGLYRRILVVPKWPLALPTLVWLGVLTAALVASLSPHWSLWGSYERAQGLFTWIALAGFAFLVYRFSAHEAFVERLLSCLVGSSALVVGYALLQAVGLDPWSWHIEEGTEPVFGPLGRGNYLAGLLVVIIPLTVGKAARTTTRWQRIALLALVAAQGLVFVLSRSRGGWLALGAVTVVGLVAWGLLQREPRWWISGLVVGGIALIGLLALTLLPELPASVSQVALLNRLAALDGADAGSVAARLTIWRTSLELIRQRPLVGHGPGTFALAFAGVYPPELVYYQGRQVMVDHAHNLWLQLGVETGISGMVAMLGLTGTVWWLGLRRLLSLERGHARILQFTLLAALLANTLMDLAQPATAATLVITWALFSLVLPPVASDGKTAVARIRAPGRARVAAILLAFLGAAVCIGLCLRPALADHQMARGLERGDPGAIAKAQALMPRQDIYYHKGGRFAADLQTPDGFVSAEAQFLRATELCPAHPLYWADLGTLYLAWANYDVAKLSKAEEAFERALDINDTQALWLRGLSRVYVTRGAWEEAEATLTEVVALDATDAQAYLLLGDVYYLQGRFSEAVSAYHSARKWWPDGALPLAGLGRSYYQQGRCTEAIPVLEESLRREPTGPLTFQALAACYTLQGQTGKAMQSLQQGLSLYPQAGALLEMLP